MKLNFISLFLIYLMISLVFLSGIVLAQPVGEPEEANCNSVRKWELEWRPKIIYCSDPLKYVDSTKGIRENRYFVYTHKPDSYTNFNLFYEGLPSNSPTINNLTADAAHWTASSTSPINDILTIDNTGAFYFARPLCEDYNTQGQCTSNGCQWVAERDYQELPYEHCVGHPKLKLSSSDHNVMAIPVENCTEEVLLATLLFEEGRINTRLSEEATSNFLNLGSYITAIVLSQVQPVPIKATPDLMTRFQGDLPALRNLLKLNDVAGFYATGAEIRPGALLEFQSKESFDLFQSIIQPKYSDILYFQPFSHPKPEIYPDLYFIAVSRKPEIVQGIQKSFNGVWLANSPQDKLANDLILGWYLYPESAVNYYVNGKPFFKGVLYDVWSSGKVTNLDSSYLLVNWQHDIDDLETKQWAQSIGNLLVKIDPSKQLINDIAQTNVNDIIYYNTGKPDLGNFKSMLDNSKNAISYKFSYLSQKSAEIESLAASSDLLIKIKGISDNIKGAIDEGDLQQLTSYKTKAINLRDSLNVDSNLIGVLNKNIQMADDAIANNLDESLITTRQSIYKNTGETTTELSKENIKIIKEADQIGSELCINPPSCTQGYLPSAEAVYEADDAAEIALASDRKISPTIQNKVVEGGGESTGLSEEQTQSWGISKEVVAGILGGAALSFVFTLGPKLREYGKYYQDDFAINVGNGIQTTGTAMSYAFIGLMGYNTVKTALELKGIAELSSLSKEVTLLGKLASSAALSFAISYAVNAIVNAVFCAVYGGPMCGCQIDDAYGTEGLYKIEKDGATIGENINYIYYGLNYCPGDTLIELEAGDSTTSWKLGNNKCATEDGRCFECTSTIENHDGIVQKPGKYTAYTVFWLKGDIGAPELGIFSPGQDFYLCQPGTTFDQSEKKCTVCDTVLQGTCGSIGGYCERALDCEDGYKCDTSNRDCTTYPATCCCLPATIDTTTPHTENGLCEYDCGASLECDEKSNSFINGYADNYESLELFGQYSANQMRSCSDKCIYSVAFDSYIENVFANSPNSDSTYTDPYFLSDQDVNVEVKVRNTGKNQQDKWFVGVEFYKVDDYTQLGATDWDSHRSQRVDAWFNGLDNTGGCDIQGCGCTYSDENDNGKFDPNEIVTVKCWAPASYWGPTTGNQRIMFWIHERDLGQDADNQGCYGDSSSKSCGSANGQMGCTSGCPGGRWWSDALSRSYRTGADDTTSEGPADAMVNIKCRTGVEDSDGGPNFLVKGTCRQYYQDASGCQVISNEDHCGCIPKCKQGSPGCDIRVISACSTKLNVADCNADSRCTWGLWESSSSGSTCTQTWKNCAEYGQGYGCGYGACSLMTVNTNSPVNYNPTTNEGYYYKAYIPLKFTTNFPISSVSYSLDGQPNVPISSSYCTQTTSTSCSINLTSVKDGSHKIMAYANDVIGNAYSNSVNFYYCRGDLTGYGTTLWVPDGKVNAKDVSLMAKFYGSKCGDGRYDARADLNDDCKIDAKDVTLVSSSYGKTCPAKTGLPAYTLPYTSGTIVSEIMFAFAVLLIVIEIFVVSLIVKSIKHSKKRKR